jgi:hypothetical protein
LLISIGLGSVVFFAIEIDKWLLRRRRTETTGVLPFVPLN